MTEFERPKAQQVLNDIFRSYSAKTSYELIEDPPPTGVTADSFAYNRRDRIYPLIAQPGWDSAKKDCDSFFSEWIVMLGLKKSLAQTQLEVELAPPHLEIGCKERKGVDIIASKKFEETDKNIPTFAINVKLQSLRNGRRVEIYKYDHILGCPSIELSLGDFTIQTKRSGNVSIVPWLRKVAAPNLTGSGHIPDFEKWQIYLTANVAETISHYMIKTDDYVFGDYKPSFEEKNIFPKTPNEFIKFYENLSFTYTIFEEICRDKGIRIN